MALPPDAPAPAVRLADLDVGSPLGPLVLTVSPAANERYWRAAGVDHPLLRAGALYPPIAANLTVLAFNVVCAEPVIQSRQRLRCARRVEAGTELVVTGAVTACYEKRGRVYVDLAAVVATSAAPANPVWYSDVTFTPAAPS